MSVDLGTDSPRTVTHWIENYYPKAREYFPYTIEYIPVNELSLKNGVRVVSLVTLALPLIALTADLLSHIGKNLYDLSKWAIEVYNNKNVHPFPTPPPVQTMNLQSEEQQSHTIEPNPVINVIEPVSRLRSALENTREAAEGVIGRAAGSAVSFLLSNARHNDTDLPIEEEEDPDAPTEGTDALLASDTEEDLDGASCVIS